MLSYLRLFLPYPQITRSVAPRPGTPTANGHAHAPVAARQADHACGSLYW